MTGELPTNVRAAFAERFLVAPIEGGVEILFAGAVFMTIEKDERLPDGFFDRTVHLVMDHLTGRKTALWDEQAIFGDRPRDAGKVRALAREFADHEEAERERIIRNEPPIEPETAGSVLEPAEPDTAGCA